MYATSYDDNKNNTNPTLHLHGYSDASFADGEDRKSTSGYLFKLAGGTICHKSVKQKLVTTSTTEAEYVALTYAAKEATWLYRLLHQLGYNEGHHERTKHVDIYYHYIKDQVRDGNLYVEHVRTHEMAADGLTKPLERQAHSRYLQQLGLTTPTIETKDYNKEGDNWHGGAVFYSPRKLASVRARKAAELDEAAELQLQKARDRERKAAEAAKKKRSQEAAKVARQQAKIERDAKQLRQREEKAAERALKKQQQQAATA
ncbi:hypothetical protein Ptr86124_003611 [Pyrenophora tritici-repentis]|uniref:Uncharacterized protein n=1 Tax=Pyrenophora tritici-repentis TaxID=45151 RepID=A0A922SXW3_9PLEO|nr:hypothetical protein Ptr86124_003611 [Pyrenophora tritici-repentis]